MRLLFAGIISLLAIPQLAFAHARLMPAGNLPPRSTNAGIKDGPCGGLARSSNPTVLQKATALTVSWEEVINHPGRFEFYFSRAGEANWQLLKTVPDDQNSNTVPHSYSTSLTLPNVDCTDCVIQMIQVMTENPAAPSLYYSCADIVLQSTAPPVTPVTPTPPTTPPSTPIEESCH